MRKIDGLFDKVTDPRMLMLGYEQTQDGDRKRRPTAITFRLMRFHRLEQIRSSLTNGTYRPGRYVTFEVREPKKRAVSAPMLPDKIVQYGVHLLLEAVYHDVFIPTSFACRGGERKPSVEKVITDLGLHDLHTRPYGDYGQHVAYKKLQSYLREVPDGWVAWVDCKKFFYTVDRDLVKKLLRKRIADERFLRLCDTIIDSSPTGERGLPLGNSTSQNFANILLNELDQYVVRFLKAKRYMRYQDDIFAVFATKQEAKEYLDKVRACLVERLHLSPNPTKTKISPVKNGITALGFKIKATHAKLKKQTTQRETRKLNPMFKTLAALPSDRREDYRDEKIRPVIGSFLGMLRWCNGYGYAKKKFGHLNYVKIEDKRYFYGRKFRPRKENRC